MRATQNRFKQANAPEGLEPAAPRLLEQAWTGDRGEASREPRPARPRAVHAVFSNSGVATSVGAIDYRLAFELAPIGLVLSRNRGIVDCNARLCEMFTQSRELLVGQTFQVLYPSRQEYERTGARIAPILNTRGDYADDRVMKRGNGETFWCHVTGRALNRAAPHEAGIWTFLDLSSRRPVKAELTAREREVAAWLMDGRTSKEIGRVLSISHRTVEIYRARLMRKYKASTTAELVHKLMAG